MSYFVTGATGFIGRNLVERLLEREGTIYVLPAETFRATPESRELVSAVPVRPRARLRVTPDDFPFREQTLGHGPADTPRSVSIRHALRPLSARTPR